MSGPRDTATQQRMPMMRTTDLESGDPIAERLTTRRRCTLLAAAGGVCVLALLSRLPARELGLEAMAGADCSTWAPYE